MTIAAIPALLFFKWVETSSGMNFTRAHILVMIIARSVVQKSLEHTRFRWITFNALL